MFQRIQILVAIGVLVLLIVVGVGGFMVGRNAGLTDQTNIRNEFFQQRSGNQAGVPGTQGAYGNQGGAPGTQGAYGNQSGAPGTQGAYGNQGGAPGTQGASGSAAGRALASGVVKSVQGNVVQVTQRDGSTTSVTLDNKVNVTKTITGTVTDIQPGWTIAVFEQTGTAGTTQRVVLTQDQGFGQGMGQNQAQGQTQVPSQGQNQGQGQGQNQGQKP